jgi:hypothetical protein
MYKVFVNDKPLFLTNQISKETDFQLFLLDSIDVEQVIVKMFQNKIKKAYLYHPDENVIMKTLKAKIPVNKAGGGLFLEMASGICQKEAPIKVKLLKRRRCAKLKKRLV